MKKQTANLCIFDFTPCALNKPSSFLTAAHLPKLFYCKESTFRGKPNTRDDDDDDDDDDDLSFL